MNIFYTFNYNIVMSKFSLHFVLMLLIKSIFYLYIF